MVSDYYDLGTYSRAVTTGSRQAQRWFDRGLYNHEEAIACYRKALDADPECAMAWWGIAYAAGPNYNKPWEAFDEDDAQRSCEPLSTRPAGRKSCRARRRGRRRP